MASTARAVSEAARRAPEQPRKARPKLDVVDRRRLASRSVRRQATVLWSLGALVVAGALSVTAAAHTFVASDQQQIDTLQARLTQTLTEQQNEQLVRSELESPERVLSIAVDKLGMISPTSVSYLAPVNPGITVVQAQELAAAARLSAAAGVSAKPGASNKSTQLPKHAGKAVGGSSQAGARLPATG
jgi:cell division protein FtsL